MWTSRLTALALLVLAGGGHLAGAGATSPSPEAGVGSGSWWLEPVVVFSFAQTLLIVILLLQWRQRRRAEQMLTERLAFEELLADLHVQFVGIGAADVDRPLHDA